MHPLAAHYADHHTGYGPINAGPQGFSCFTLRAKTDSGAVYLHRPAKPGDNRQPTRRHPRVRTCVRCGAPLFAP